MESSLRFHGIRLECKLHGDVGRYYEAELPRPFIIIAKCAVSNFQKSDMFQEDSDGK